MIFIFELIGGTLPFLLLIITGVFLTARGNFFQFKKFFSSVRLVIKAFKAPKSKDELTSFKAACTALSSTVGTGNIAGVAGALALGGAGACFWMWVSAIFGMAVKAAEIALSVAFRERMGKKFHGGPIYYIKNALPRSFGILSLIFAALLLPAVIVGGNLTQTGASVDAVSKSPFIKILIGIIFCVLTAVIAGGGIKRIGAFTEKLVPFMSLLYVFMALTVIFFNINRLPTAFKMIFEGAFNPRAVTGGAIGSMYTAVMIGSSRGVFSNEAGLGTSGMAHSAAADANRETQGLFGIFEVFIDTLLLCTLTALTILCSGVNIDYGNPASSELVQLAIKTVFGNWSQILVAVMMCIFGFSSIVGWAVYGEIGAEFLMGKKGGLAFKIIYPLFCILGAAIDTALVWQLATFFNGALLVINLPVILILSDKFLESDKNDRKNKYNKKHIGTKRSGAHYK